METADILSLVTIIVTLILGFISKKSKFINNNLIPVQNVIIGIVMCIVNYLITKDVSAAVLTSGILAGGIYDIGNNINKMLYPELKQSEEHE